jgi:hypothetical protein
VTLNGQSLGTLWSLPFQVAIPAKLLKEKNHLEIEVKPFDNRMRYIDKQSHNWKQFKDINIVDIQYKALEPSTWEPEPSGLLDPFKYFTKNQYCGCRIEILIFANRIEK